MESNLKNYNKVISEFTLLKRRFENDGNIINPLTVGYIQFITAGYWFELFLNAKNEIENIFMVGSPHISGKVKADFETLSNWIAEIRIVNANKLTLTVDKRFKYIVDHPESEEAAFCNIEGQFLTFMNPIVKLLNLTTSSSNGKKIRKTVSLSDAWSDLKGPELVNQLQLLCSKGYLEMKDDRSLHWKGKEWKNLAAIIEIWKEKKYLKSVYSKFGEQRALCVAVCVHFNIKNIDSVYNGAFKKAKIATDDGVLNPDIRELKRTIALNLTS